MSTGISEEGLVFSDGYAETMEKQVLPFLREHCEERTVSGVEGKPLAAFRYAAENPKGTVLVLHGFTECAAKFSELIFSLLQNGYSVLAYDQRGHGASWRDERVPDLSLTHVTRFEEYVQDLRAVCDQALKDMPKPWYIFSHSMGGAVNVAFLEEFPGVFEKAVLCAPMIAPHRAGMPLWVGKTMCNGMKLTGQSRRRVFISKPWSGPEDFETSCASGRERFDWYDSLRMRNKIYQNNGPTYGWTLEAFRVTKRLLGPGAPERIQIPIRIYTAETDNQVLPEAQAQLVAHLAKGMRKVIAGAKHEIYRSTDAVLFPWWKEILDFFG